MMTMDMISAIISPLWMSSEQWKILMKCFFLQIIMNFRPVHTIRARVAIKPIHFPESFPGQFEKNYVQMAGGTIWESME